MRNSYSIKASVLSCSLEKERVLLDPDSALYFHLNDTGSKLWGVVSQAEKISFEDIILELKSHFHEVPETYEDDILEFIEELEKNGLIQKN